jgi:hypothetical protein
MFRLLARCSCSLGGPSGGILTARAVLGGQSTCWTAVSVHSGPSGGLLNVASRLPFNLTPLQLARPMSFFKGSTTVFFNTSITSVVDRHRLMPIRIRLSIVMPLRSTPHQCLMPIRYVGSTGTDTGSGCHFVWVKI